MYQNAHSGQASHALHQLAQEMGSGLSYEDRPGSVILCGHPALLAVVIIPTVLVFCRALS